MAKLMKQEERNWLDLPYDVMVNILNRVGMINILESAELVCTTWHKICKDPVLWRVIDTNDLRSYLTSSSANVVCKHAVDRSQGQLVDITLVYDYGAQLLLYVIDRSSHLRRLEMAMYGSFIRRLIAKALMKFPMLEELNLYDITVSEEEIETMSRYCPMLKTLKVNYNIHRSWKKFTTVEESLKYSNALAIAIGRHLVKLRHLELIGNNMTSIGLQVILDNCHDLETLDLRACFNLDLKGDLGKKCCEQIKHLKLPKDSLKAFADFDVYNDGDADLLDKKKLQLFFAVPETQTRPTKRKRFTHNPVCLLHVPPPSKHRVVHAKVMKQQSRNWLDLPYDVMANILKRISMVDIFENVEKVCTAWSKICKDPSMWRIINMKDLMCSTSNAETATNICKHAVDRAQGQLVDITLVVHYEYKADLLQYVAARSHQLKRLEVESSTFVGSLNAGALIKFPLLEELNLYLITISEEVIETIGRYCPMLKTLKLNGSNTDEESLMHLNEIAIAIGQNLVGLRHLELIGNKMTNVGLQAILDNCHHLQTLDLRACLNIHLNGDLRKKCFKQIKYLKLPRDSLQGWPSILEKIDTEFLLIARAFDLPIDLAPDTQTTEQVMMPSTLNLKRRERNWLDLPTDVTANILNKVGMVDILDNAEKVCTSWRKICKDPATWRVIYMNGATLSSFKQKISNMCKHAVDRSKGQLVDIPLMNPSDDSLLPHIADS
ncbi:hypothetical protein QVD17_36099 [Tagetes erecta]|uniref:F-box domain-containing protein n=1 Tax=Tagetes erecta TaxID=13708 RepID=A0AAD8JVN5_TARER|nr:hypothetical protein QVD17_36099 [Tagetes erecta]